MDKNEVNIDLMGEDELRRELKIALDFAIGQQSDIDELQTEQVRLGDAFKRIAAVASGEEQVAEDDSEGMGWIYHFIQKLDEQQKVRSGVSLSDRTET